MNFEQGITKYLELNTHDLCSSRIRKGSQFSAKCESAYLIFTVLCDCMRGSNLSCLNEICLLNVLT